VQGFSLRQLQHLVLDEADRILSLDFEEDIDKILKARRAPPHAAALACSAALRSCRSSACLVAICSWRAKRVLCCLQVIPTERRTQLYSATMTSKARARCCITGAAGLRVSLILLLLIASDAPSELWLLRLAVCRWRSCSARACAIP
jgi:hypothetical protein